MIYKFNQTISKDQNPALIFTNTIFPKSWKVKFKPVLEDTCIRVKVTVEVPDEELLQLHIMYPEFSRALEVNIAYELHQAKIRNNRMALPMISRKRQ